MRILLSSEGGEGLALYSVNDRPLRLGVCGRWPLTVAVAVEVEEVEEEPLTPLGRPLVTGDDSVGCWPTGADVAMLFRSW